ncbi:MAG: N-acetyltransferase [Spirochaetaceae bacterium]|jgi:predicted N-acetyltransferase YhbS|nr:N-acetyltransferase [Spirochaetaceae bacterium]
MSNHNTTIRIERQTDYVAVERLTFAAFETMELPGRTHTNEHFLAHLLRGDPDFVPELDFVAEQNGEIVGNIIHSKCAVIRPDGTETEALVFGPVSVKPELHRQGVGTMLIEHSLRRARELGYKAVLITGHPDYYRRFGFVPASAYGITTLDGKSFDAFMALELDEGYLGMDGGRWKCCKAFDICENDTAAFRRFHLAFTNKNTSGR